MLQVLAEEEHLDELGVAKTLGNLSNDFDEGVETYVYMSICAFVFVCVRVYMRTHVYFDCMIFLYRLVRSRQQLELANEITLSSIKNLIKRLTTILSDVLIMANVSTLYAHGFRQTTSLLLTVIEQIGR